MVFSCSVRNAESDSLYVFTRSANVADYDSEYIVQLLKPAKPPVLP